jgi:hypothetical protein
VQGFSPAAFAGKEGASNESTGISKKNLRQVQGDSSPRSGAGNLHQPEAQATAGIISPFVLRVL